MASQQNLAEVKVDENLKHVAFIMDGNGRWAKKQGKPREYGHPFGAKTFKNIVRYCGKIGIKYVTFYSFSTENWKRPKVEVEAIMRLFKKYLEDAFDEARENNMKIVVLGDRTPFTKTLRNLMDQVEADSAGNTSTVLNIAMNYGSRAEIVRAVNLLIAEGKTEITEEEISSHLYTAHCPPPDLIVRTGSEQRLSNFLLWQAAYSELYFSDVLWPDFSSADVDAAIREFYHRKRRFGGI